MLLASWQVSLMARRLWVQGLFKVLFSLLFWFLNSDVLPKTKTSGLLDNTTTFWSSVDSCCANKRHIMSD